MKALRMEMLSKKEKKRLEDEEFERQLAEALGTAQNTNKVVDDPKKNKSNDASGADGADGGADGRNGTNNKKKKRKNKNKGKGGVTSAAAETAPSPKPIVAKSEGDLEKARHAKLAKIKAAEAKHLCERKKVNDKLKAIEKKKKAQQKAMQIKQNGGDPKWNYSSDNGVGGDGRGG